ncbi:hypothetical protein [uncultured Bacteroides sp.]|uniref:hypothetical protein n=1 Tax=uncultured Bacteroides sp. TaxID=162156 RepID=UPI00262E5109|nr:hypothetical protein [uncultured Bacteroides sp.]
MNEEEKNAISASAELWNAFMKLEQYHPDDIKNVLFHIHAIQSIIMSREAVRNNPELFPIRK